jgi:hypothetical protein
MSSANTSQQRERAPNSRDAKRRGNIIVLSAFLMVIMMAMVAFSVDVGYMCTMRAELQRAVDAAALAGAQELVNGVSEAQDKAKEYLVRNPVGGGTYVTNEAFLLDAIQEFDDQYGEGLTMTAGNWNPETRELEETDFLPSSLHVHMRYENLPFFFARVLGYDTFDLEGESIAMFQPRDIVLVLDYSASMNDDSEFTAFSNLGQSEVEANLLECYQDLGSPVYGNMQFAPTWATVPGAAQDDTAGIPHVTVQYQFSSAYVTSTHSLTTVKLKFSNGNTQSFSPGTTTGTFTGSGTNAGKQITNVWVKSWNNATTFGADGEPFNFTSGAMNATIKTALGLTSVPYPYPSGSWDAYIDWCESSSNQNKNAGYRYKFGYMSWIVWMLENKPAYSQSPDLWKMRAEPMAALKSSVDVFMDFIQSVDTNDQCGLAIYNAPDGEGQIDIPLTNDLSQIATSVQQKQAGHYHSYTNIGAGLHSARLHLDSNGRSGASKMIVLMTDGNANWVNGAYNESAANAYVISEANACAAAKYPVMTISLGAAADTSIMQQAADITGGVHYNVPGGSSQDDYYQQLYDVFEEIAKARPLKLVK